MAHKKGEGSVKNGRDSQSKRLGVKIFGGQAAVAGNIIVSVSAVPNIIPEKILVWAETSHYLHSLMVL